MEISIYTDGACSGNPGPGGYAFYIISNSQGTLISGAKKDTTNNHMELMAIVRAIRHVLNNEQFDKKCPIIIYSDSAYIINAIKQGWFNFWKANDWKTKQNTDLKNCELWKMLDKLLLFAGNRISFIKVKGHDGNQFNELVDRAAREAIKRLSL